MHTGYDLILLIGTASEYCTGKLAEEDAGCDHRA